MSHCGSRSARAADGNYVFAGLTVGAYSIRAPAHGFASRNFGRPSTGPNAQKIAVSEGLALENIDIELIAGGAISGNCIWTMMASLWKTQKSVRFG